MAKFEKAARTGWLTLHLLQFVGLPAEMGASAGYQIIYANGSFHARPRCLYS